VGKSSLLIQYLDGIFDTELISTIGVDFRVTSIDIDDSRVKLQIWDTAGQERFRAMTRSYFNGAHGVAILYDVTSPKSFDHVDEWHNQLSAAVGDREGVCVILIANKTDLVDRQVSSEAGEEKAKSLGISYMETSAKENANVREMFDLMAKEMVQMAQTKSSMAAGQEVILAPGMQITGSTANCC
jgi:small GTP-binding protein